MVMRSDESANEAEIERDQNFRGNVGKGVKAASGLASAGVGGALAAKIMPFLNQYIPAGLAMKGINKVSPKLGAFLQKGQDMGMDVQDGLDFLKEQIGASQKETPKEDRNLIEQYDPNLFIYVRDLIKNGSSPIDAAAKAKKFLDKKQQDVISKMEKDHKTDWGSIVQSVFGGEGTGNQQQGQQQPLPPQGAQPQQQGGPGQQALMGILQKISQSLGP